MREATRGAPAFESESSPFQAKYRDRSWLIQYANCQFLPPAAFGNGRLRPEWSSGQIVQGKEDADDPAHTRCGQYG